MPQDFKAKMHQICFSLTLRPRPADTPPQTLLGELTALPQTP